jgi:hypothetical protein
VATLPSADSQILKGQAQLIGFVADSLSTRPMKDALVLLIRIDSSVRDTTRVLSNEMGQFAVGLQPGLYRYLVGSINFLRGPALLEFVSDSILSSFVSLGRRRQSAASK